MARRVLLDQSTRMTRANVGTYVCHLRDIILLGYCSQKKQIKTHMNHSNFEKGGNDFI